VAKKTDGVVALLVILIMGALIGSVIGEVIQALAPGGYVAAIFAEGISPGITPPRYWTEGLDADVQVTMPDQSCQRLRSPLR
jgi:hypothetical protein